MPASRPASGRDNRIGDEDAQPGHIVFLPRADQIERGSLALSPNNRWRPYHGCFQHRVVIIDREDDQAVVHALTTFRGRERPSEREMRRCLPIHPSPPFPPHDIQLRFQNAPPPQPRAYVLYTQFYVVEWACLFRLRHVGPRGRGYLALQEASFRELMRISGYSRSSLTLVLNPQRPCNPQPFSGYSWSGLAVVFHPQQSGSSRSFSVVEADSPDSPSSSGPGSSSPSSQPPLPLPLPEPTMPFFQDRAADHHHRHTTRQVVNDQPRTLAGASNPHRSSPSIAGARRTPPPCRPQGLSADANDDFDDVNQWVASLGGSTRLHCPNLHPPLLTLPTTDDEEDNDEDDGQDE